MAISKIELYKDYEEADAGTTACEIQFVSLSGDYEHTLNLKPESATALHSTLADTIAVGKFTASDSINSTDPSYATPTCVTPSEWFVVYGES